MRVDQLERAVRKLEQRKRKRPKLAVIMEGQPSPPDVDYLVILTQRKEEGQDWSRSG